MSVGVAALRGQAKVGRRNRLFAGVLVAATVATVAVLTALLVDLVTDGAVKLSLNFLVSYPSRFADRAGIRAALLGTLWLMAMTALLTIPLGIGAAVYLEEFAPSNRITRAIETNIANLAGVPSIIYGIFGLALFVRALNLGYTLIAAALTLSLVILPIVIVAAIEAIEAVPRSQREAAFALGSTRWQVVRGAVLPAAAPGILTGIILAMARAIGETAPLILIGAVAFVTYLPSPIEGGYTVLPIQIFSWASRFQPDFQAISASAIIVMLAVLFVLNALALVVRIRLSRHIQW
jgi:phosphate transport system permease protein